MKNIAFKFKSLAIKLKIAYIFNYQVGNLDILVIDNFVNILTSNQGLKPKLFPISVSVPDIGIYFIRF